MMKTWNCLFEMIINEKVSDVSAIKEIREFAVMQQQIIGKNKGGMEKTETQPVEQEAKSI